MTETERTGGIGMQREENWLRWAVELQSLAQAGLAYGKDVYDLERYTRIREIAAEMLVEPSGLPLERVKDLFCRETGYQTPKLDSRAAIFRDGKVLLVQENDGRWSLPGGWVEVDLSVGENTVKEAKEEAGVDVVPERLIAVQDRARHNQPLYAYGVCKIFVLCKLLGGRFEKNSETLQSRWFGEDELPALAEEKNTAQQIRMCFQAARDPDWKVQFE